MSHVNQTILITGSSTGIGKTTALRFIDAGWNVIATMRAPEKEQQLKNSEQVLVTKLDVTDQQTIEAAIQAGIDKFGRIDAVVNNAGYGLSGTFESMTMEQIKRQFDTNVFGLMAVTQAMLPHFREHQAGTIINVASVAGRVAFPLYSIYHGTKWAVDGFSESLQFELKPLGIKVRIVEPGAIKTDFYDRSAEMVHDEQLTAYNRFVTRARRSMDAAKEKGSDPAVVANTIYAAATDSGWTLRYPSGLDAKWLLAIRRFLPDSWYRTLVQKALKL